MEQQRTKWIMIGAHLITRTGDYSSYSVFSWFEQVEGDTREECLAEAARIHGPTSTIGSDVDMEWAGPYEVVMTLCEGEDPDDPENYYVEDQTDATGVVESHPAIMQAKIDAEVERKRKQAQEAERHRQQAEKAERQRYEELHRKYGSK